MDKITQFDLIKTHKNYRSADTAIASITVFSNGISENRSGAPLILWSDIHSVEDNHKISVLQLKNKYGGTLLNISYLFENYEKLRGTILSMLPAPTLNEFTLIDKALLQQSNRKFSTISTVLIIAMISILLGGTVLSKLGYKSGFDADSLTNLFLLCLAFLVPVQMILTGVRKTVHRTLIKDSVVTFESLKETKQIKLSDISDITSPLKHRNTQLRLHGALGPHIVGRKKFAVSPYVKIKHRTNGSLETFTLSAGNLNTLIYHRLKYLTHVIRKR